MTFIDAALEILRKEKAPLHAKEITKRAVDMELLSHVGKSPEVTMSKRISESVARGKSPFTRVRPGVYGLIEWSDTKKDTVKMDKENKDGSARKEFPPLPKGPGRSKKRPVKGPKPKSGQQSAQKTGPNSVPDSVKDNTPLGNDKNLPTQPRKIKKTVVPKSVHEPARPQNNLQNRPQERQPAGNNEPMPDRVNGRKNEIRKDNNFVKKPDVNNKNRAIISRIEHLLSSVGGAISSHDIAKKMHLNMKGADIFVDSLINAKNRFNELEGKEPSYKYSNNGWIHIKTSSDFQHSKLFSKLDNSVDELTLLAVKEMEKYIRTLNDKELLQVVMLHLLKKGYGNITLQQKGQNGEFYLSYTELDSDGQYVEALALKCSRGNNTLTADDVALLRGRLSGFGAQAGFLITSGDVHKDAVDAGNAPNLTVITCIGANMLASILVKDGIGVKVKTLKIPVFDKHEFFSEGL